MEKIFTTCNRCKKEIKYGQAYVTILRNIEQVDYNMTTGEDEIEVIDSNDLVTFCGSCGNSFNADMITNIINSIPLQGRQQGN